MERILRELEIQIKEKLLPVLKSNIEDNAENCVLDGCDEDYFKEEEVEPQKEKFVKHLLNNDEFVKKYVNELVDCILSSIDDDWDEDLEETFCGFETWKKQTESEKETEK